MVSKIFDFIVLGSKGDEYQISIEVSSEKVKAFCSCPGGTYTGACKHVLGILDGDGSSLTDQSQTESLKALTCSISGHPVMEYVRKWNEANKILKEAEQKAKAAKESIRKYLNPSK